MVIARVRNAGRDHVAIADRLDLLKAIQGHVSTVSGDRLTF
jgi:hypothetical protein